MFQVLVVAQLKQYYYSLFLMQFALFNVINPSHEPFDVKFFEFRSDLRFDLVFLFCQFGSRSRVYPIFGCTRGRQKNKAICLILVSQLNKKKRFYKNELDRGYYY